MLTALLAATLAVSPPLTPISPRLLNVAGEAQLTFPANHVTATLQITAKERDLPAARRGVEVKQKAMQKVLSAAGIDGKHLWLQDSGPSPEYRGNEIVAQSFTRTIVITFTDLSKLEDTMTALMRAGGVQTASLTLRNTEQRAYEQKARIAAAVSAKERAVGLIETLGGKLGLPRMVTDQSTGGQSVATAYVALPQEGNATVNLMDLTVLSQVSVQFDIRDEG